MVAFFITLPSVLFAKGAYIMKINPGSRTDAVKQKPTVKDWLPCIGLAVAAFVFNTTEFVPIALLSDIGRDFGVSEAKAGMLITIYAWVVGLVSLPLTLIFGQTERRKLLVTLLLVFIVAHIASWQSTSYNMLLASRLLIAGCHAIFWSVSVPMAAHLAPQGYRSAGLGVMATGSALATVLGLPIGRTVGLYMGWRITFLSIGFVSALVLILMLVVLPRFKSNDSGSVKSLPGLMHNRGLIGVYMLTVVLVTAQFTAYTYIEPFMMQVAKMSENIATIALLVFGAAGIIGNFIFSRYNDTRAKLLTPVSLVSISISLLLMLPMSANLFTMFSLCVFWGIVLMVFNLVFQDAIMRLAPQATAVAMAIYSGIYNIGIGSGAFVGANVITFSDIKNIGLFAFAICSVAVIFYFLYLKRYFFRTVK